MMTALNAGLAGTFRIGGDLIVNRLGFGAMRLTGLGIWGPPADEAAAIRLLRALPELGINLIDTADSYGPDISEPLIREALHPYGGLVVATKGGLVRPGPDRWLPSGRPEHLIQQARMSLRHLGVERIDLWQLHRIDPRVPRDEQFGAIRFLLDSGIIRHAGLSEVTVDDLEAAAQVFPVATVQNRYNLVGRDHEAVLDYAEARGIGFIPWFPLASGQLARPGTALDAIATRHGVAPAVVALAWMLSRSPVMLPIPDTGRLEHLRDNVRAAGLVLDQAEFAALDAEGHAVSGRS
jgi:aryl-alcohol dehydrogenase-like predicted oxidoreductase